MDFENYATPPIQEAVLDIFTTLPADAGLEALDGFGQKVFEQFPQKKPRYRFSSSIRVNLEDSSKSSADGSSTQIGWIYRTNDKERAVQSRLDGFTFNRLPTYQGWAKFSTEAQTLWRSYCDVAAPQFITSVGLRYINRVMIPMPFRDFRDYCVLFPDFPKGIPSALSEFVMRLVAPSTHVAKGTSAITVTFQPPSPNQAVLPLILDVHVTQKFPALPASEDGQIWPAFDLLRVEKNALFESSITDNARALFRQ